MTIEEAIHELESIRRVYAHIRRNDGEWEAVEMAIAALRARQETEKNDPLTIEELREMGGQPCYRVSLRGGRNHWSILDSFVAKYPESYDYGKRWLAYRRPPDGEV